VDLIVPVDIYLPGCPPRPEALIDAFRKLQHRIAEHGGASRKPEVVERSRSRARRVLATGEIPGREEPEATS